MSSFELPKDLPSRELQALRVLERVPGVAAASLHLDPDAPDTATRVFLAITTAFEGEQVRAMASQVLETLGIDAPEDCFTIAQLQPGVHSGAVSLRPSAPPIRALVRHDLRIQTSSRRVTCQVELMRQGVLLSAEASDLDTPEGRARAAARATLEAAQMAFPGFKLALEGIVAMQLFGRDHIVVSVEGISGRSSTRLTAAVHNESSPEETACLATLRAVERWLTV